MSMKDLKKYKHVVIKMKSVLSWEEYVYTLFFIKKQKEILAPKYSDSAYEGFQLNNELLELVLSYNTKVLMKIRDSGGENTRNLLSANGKIYKVLFKLTNFKIDLFEHKIADVFCGFNSKERKRIIKLVSENWFLFDGVNVDELVDLDRQISENKPGAIGYFNEINEKINTFLRDKNF